MKKSEIVELLKKAEVSGFSGIVSSKLIEGY